MEPFVRLEGLVAPLDRANVDTDQIVPKQFLKRIERTGFGDVLFYDWRFLPDGSPNPDFVLNRPEYQGATILVTGSNFGCGSSREHAPWALREYGFRVLIAPSFADIFRNNCLRNGLLPLSLAEGTVREFMEAAMTAGYKVVVDLAEQQITDASGRIVPFSMDPFWRRCLMEGLDEIGLTLSHEDSIRHYEARRPMWMPAVHRRA